MGAPYIYDISRLRVKTAFSSAAVLVAASRRISELIHGISKNEAESQSEHN